MPQPAVLNPPSFMFDSPVSSSSTFQVEDFFNLDLLAGNDDARSSTSALNNNNSSTSANSNSNSNSNSASSSSRASSEAGSDSPAGSFSHLQTPPQSEALTSFDLMNFDSSSFGGLPPIEEESIFTVGGHSGASDFFKPGTDPLAGLSHSPFDLFASFDAQLNGINNSNSAISDTNSSSSASAPATAASTSFSFGAIDPQLTRTPATPTTTTDDHSENGADQDSDDELSHKLIIAPIKVGGKGKARRGTLQSGGVSKKPALPGPQSIFGSLASNEGPSAPMGRGLGQGKSFAKEKISRGQDQDDDDKDDDADDWRPSPEEYAKMSSKEKRQLRNKISARNFRIRRKEYIATLEGDIADRDRLIDAIRSELGSTRSENNALRQEVEVLKKAILEGRASPMLPPPAPLSPLSPLSSFATLPGSSSSNASAGTGSKSNNIIKPNTHKDLPTSPRLGASPFWGGQAGGFGSFGGGITPVHTAIIPETGASVFGVEDRQKENINPALNIPVQHQPQQQQVLSQVLAQLYGNGNNSMPKNDSNMHAAPNSFDSFGFADVNPFTLKTLDAYRMQLWGRAAAQVQEVQRERVRSTYTQSPAAATGYPSPPHSSPAHSPNPNAALSGLASSLRPQYFASTNSRTSPSSPTSMAKPFGSLLSNKGMPYGPSAHHHHGLPTPPASPHLSDKDRSASASASQQQVRRAMQQKEREQREQAQTHAMLATLASHTLVQKLGVAFWEAFSFTPGSAFGSAPGTRNWDSEKVRRVLDGSAVLKVVDVDRSSPSSSGSAETLAESMRGLSLDNKHQEKQNRQDAEKKGLFARMSSSCSGDDVDEGLRGDDGGESDEGHKVGWWNIQRE
ncbi:hypothetical protein ACEPAI_2973 [Sanghuangporus weigelae]